MNSNRLFLSSRPPGRSGARRFRRLSRRRFLLACCAALVLWLAAVAIYQTHKPLPPGISYESPVYRVQNLNFLYDLTYPDGSPDGAQESRILPRMLEMIEESREFLVVDLFLFNDYTHKDQTFPQVSALLADKLIAHKQNHPGMDIVFITDEVNTNYGSAPNPLLERMTAAGIPVAVTDVDALRDSTPLYSAVWRTFIQWFGQSGRGGLPNLMASGGPDITVRSYLKLLNVKANHRKLLVSEKGALVSSGNVHDASAYHSNIAFEVTGPVIADMVETERSAAALSGGSPALEALNRIAGKANSLPQDTEGDIEIRYLTEGAIYRRLLADLSEAGAGDTVWIGMFYLADDKVTRELLRASDRGADVRLVLDPNQNAFGRDKIGIPNRPVAMDLHNRSDGAVRIRWYNTTQEQYHTKLMFIAKAKGPSILLGGSANFTPRNLDDYNLENNLWASFPKEQPVHGELVAYFNRLWNNTDASYTLPLEAYQSEYTWLKYAVFRLQNLLGFTTF